MTAERHPWTDWLEAGELETLGHAIAEAIALGDPDALEQAADEMRALRDAAHARARSEFIEQKRQLTLRDRRELLRLERMPDVRREIGVRLLEPIPPASLWRRLRRRIRRAR